MAPRSQTQRSRDYQNAGRPPQGECLSCCAPVAIKMSTAYAQPIAPHMIATVDPTSARWDDEYDLVVLGAGAGGMTAALVGATEGLRTLLVEKTDRIGGTTARSGGALWIPDSPQQRKAGTWGDAEDAHRYLDALVGDRTERSLREAFIAAGKQMVEYLDRHTDVRFELSPNEFDYRPELPGASAARVLRPLPFDGRTLGAQFGRVGFPLPELMLFGGMMVTRPEVARLLQVRTSWKSFAFAAALTARYIGDRLRYKRGTRLVLGNALAARLFKNLLTRGVTIWFDSHAKELISSHGGILGVIVARDGVDQRIRARRGIVLAGGGFPASAEMRARFLPKPVPQFTPAFEGCTGDTLLLGEHVGAELRGSKDNALWFPSSIGKRRDGSTAVFPHIAMDRAKPGLIAVNAAGKRFVGEAVSYHEFVRAMYRSQQQVASVPTRLICDRRFLWKYGLGMIHPRTRWLGGFIRSGYLSVGNSLPELATVVGVDANGLLASVERHNEFARTGVDEEFGKGQNPYERANGDPSHSPNPCIGLIETPPFYSVAVFPTPLGTSLGLRTNAYAQVLHRSGEPLRGLYACGNDMQSVMGGEYAGPGAQLGPAMTFGYLAAKHALTQESDTAGPESGF